MKTIESQYGEFASRSLFPHTHQRHKTDSQTHHDHLLDRLNRCVLNAEDEGGLLSGQTPPPCSCANPTTHPSQSPARSLGSSYRPTRVRQPVVRMDDQHHLVPHEWSTARLRS